MVSDDDVDYNAALLAASALLRAARNAENAGQPFADRASEVVAIQTGRLTRETLGAAVAAMRWFVLSHSFVMGQEVPDWLQQSTHLDAISRLIDDQSDDSRAELVEHAEKTVQVAAAIFKNAGDAGFEIAWDF